MVAKLTDIKGIGPAKAETLEENGFESVEELANADPDVLADVDGVGDDRALEFIVGAENVLEPEEEEVEGDEFDLTPSEVGEELEHDSDDAESGESASDEEEDVTDTDEDETSENESESESEDTVYDVALSFATRMEYDTFHAAVMQHHEDVYTSHQPAADVINDVLEQLYGNEVSVNLEIDEYGLNTLHTSVKRKRTEYQGDNLIDQMEALQNVEQQIDDVRREELF